MRGYKIFGPDYTCREHKYSLYSPNTYEGEDIIPCMSGFHYCLQAIDCLKYYDYDPKNTYAEVECGKEYRIYGDKVVCKVLNIIRVLSYSEFGKLITFDVTTPLEKFSYVNGKLDGRYILYHTPEKIKIDTHYMDGKRHGGFKLWYSTGQLKIEKSYIDDKCNGTYIEWYVDGSITKEIGFKNDKCDDSYKEWFQNGQIRKEMSFKNGKCKTYKEWGADGKLLKQEYA